MNLSGYGINKVFKTGINPAKPYYYITASLDLSNAVYNGTYYFNYDNDYQYANNRDYSRFISVDDNMILSEVVVYTDPDMVEYDAERGVYFSIGGAESVDGKPKNAVKVYWAAPSDIGVNNPPSEPHYNGYPLTIDELNDGAVNYYGHEGGHFPYFLNNEGTADTSVKYRYLAVTITDTLPTDPDDPRSLVGEQEVEVKVESDVDVQPEAPKGVVGPPDKSVKSSREKKVITRGLPSGEKAIVEGKLTVVLKIYPKTQ
jgi:hypothetical protein